MRRAVSLGAAVALATAPTWSLPGRIGDVGFGAAHMVLLANAVLGFCATFFLAARIAYVIGRTKEAYRARQASEG